MLALLCNIGLFRSLALSLAPIPALAGAAAAQPPPRSILVVTEAAVGGPFYPAVFSSLQTAVNRTSKQPASMYLENLDPTVFDNPNFEQSQRTFLASKYNDKQIGIVVAIGKSALVYVLRERDQLWPNIPVVFSFVNKADLQTLALPADVTGHTTTVSLRDMLDTAWAIMPDLERVAVLGDRLERQPAYQYIKKEIPTISLEMPVLDLTDIPMRELKSRVAGLPERTAIIYTAIYSDGEGARFPPVRALSLLAEVANRPIVISVETFIGHGGVGGKVAGPSALGEDAAKLALRILDGENASAIPIVEGNATRSVFDWRQLQRWNVDLSRLPAGSEIRFRPPSPWDTYKLQILFAAAILLIQSALIIRLLYEHRRRRVAEAEAIHRANELSHMNRIATAGELSASIAHELKQPLAAIAANGSAGVHWLARAVPDVDQARDVLKRIVDQSYRATQIIDEVRALFRKDCSAREIIDLNLLVPETLVLVEHELRMHKILLQAQLSQHPPPYVKADKVQLKQVILNLVINAIEAMASGPTDLRVLTISSTTNTGGVVVTVADSGPGVAPENSEKIYEMFFTTKPHGMGVGLPMCRSIIESHGGRLMLSRSQLGGCRFQIYLPTAQVKTND